MKDSGRNMSSASRRTSIRISHCISRAKERYGLDLSPEDIDGVENQIKEILSSAKGATKDVFLLVVKKWVYHYRPTFLFKLTINNIVAVVAYESLTNHVVTFLPYYMYLSPEEWYTTNKSARRIYKRRYPILVNALLGDTIKVLRIEPNRTIIEGTYNKHGIDNNKRRASIRGNS